MYNISFARKVIYNSKNDGLAFIPNVFLFLTFGFICYSDLFRENIIIVILHERILEFS